MNAHSFQSEPNLALVPFPDHQSDELAKLYTINAQTHLEPNALTVRFTLQGHLHFIETSLPTMTPHHVDGLWKSTVFEVFVGHEGLTSYLEVNGAPSGDYASYVFKSYRKREDAGPYTEKTLRVTISSEFVTHNQLVLDIRIPRGLLDEALPHFTISGLRVGLAAVLEDRRHHLSYWALGHQSAAPDFHKAECFTHRFKG